MSRALGMAKINWRHSRVAQLITGIAFLVGFVQYILDNTVNVEGNISLAAGNYLFLLPLFMGIFVTALNFPRLLHLGGKRMDFFKSGIITYAGVAVFASLLSMLTYFTTDRLMLAHGRIAGIIDLYNVFGFMSRGPVVAFLQMTSFLLLVAVVAHTLTLIQGHWYGWVTDVLIIAIISVFTPIAPLRAALIWFFNMIIFHELALVQILCCLLLSALIYCASLIPIRSKQI